MSIEPLRREAVRRPTALRAGPPARPAGHQMCVVVSEVADGDGSTLVSNLRRRGSHRVVVLTRRASRAELGVLLAGGLRGAVASTTTTSLVRLPAPPPPPAELPELTAREVSVLKLVADGRSNRLIGDDLGLSALTVKSHLARISRKFGTGDRAELVAISIRGGILS
ncbi:helix-turn-helix transcriptional regulator [Cellulomonas edaphi]|uniref:LuxR C-terminal-related transcriptional regulator n=1 Tax=Cellulomonas edaphi TaxID=3053468 RepID=A0ABT7S6W1_9CELL|nr:LuxR C-terminal-related transcriptional regulator [Cellulomons edaphi]MDM7831353.1 LuxR C-terminal-related transcriptional regulator [Cellulomons edaphi]